ncbi:hypothetical protein F4780DRAFT_793793 [Xylariomycetidae sp. FL0641]|nr:hypothetical protein F4780DRAFT_793793 [Xylariomycetidae sp. FL0641]
MASPRRSDQGPRTFASLPWPEDGTFLHENLPEVDHPLRDGPLPRFPLPRKNVDFSPYPERDIPGDRRVSPSKCLRYHGCYRRPSSANETAGGSNASPTGKKDTGPPISDEPPTSYSSEEHHAYPSSAFQSAATRKANREALRAAGYDAVPPIRSRPPSPYNAVHVPRAASLDEYHPRESATSSSYTFGGASRAAGHEGRPAVFRESADSSARRNPEAFPDSSAIRHDNDAFTLYDRRTAHGAVAARGGAYSEYHAQTPRASSYAYGEPSRAAGYDARAYDFHESSSAPVNGGTFATYGETSRRNGQAFAAPGLAAAQRYADRVAPSEHPTPYWPDHAARGGAPDEFHARTSRASDSYAHRDPFQAAASYDARTSAPHERTSYYAAPVTQEAYRYYDGYYYADAPGAAPASAYREAPGATGYDAHPDVANGLNPAANRHDAVPSAAEPPTSAAGWADHARIGAALRNPHPFHGEGTGAAVPETAARSPEPYTPQSPTAADGVAAAVDAWRADRFGGAWCRKLVAEARRQFTGKGQAQAQAQATATAYTRPCTVVTTSGWLIAHEVVLAHPRPLRPLLAVCRRGGNTRWKNEGEEEEEDEARGCWIAYLANNTEEDGERVRGGWRWCDRSIGAA